MIFSKDLHGEITMLDGSSESGRRLRFRLPRLEGIEKTTPISFSGHMGRLLICT